jgi:hypothetical protein
MSTDAILARQDLTYLLAQQVAKLARLESMPKALNQGNLAKSAARGFTSLTREPLFKVTVRHAKWANTTM